MSERKSPNPGSAEAVRDGCTCPVLDNAHGAGYRGDPDLFVMDAACPLHGIEVKVARVVGAAVRVPDYCSVHQHYKWCEHNGGILRPGGWEAPADE